MSALNGNTFYISTASSAGTDTTFVVAKDVLVDSIICTCSAAGAGSLQLNDLAYSNGTYSAGDLKVNIILAATTSIAIPLSGNPIRFPNGIWVSGVSNTAATLVIRTKG